jgi:hypothetical protein
MLHKPFEDAYDEFLRSSPPGARPAVIEVGRVALAVFRRFSPDETYDLDGHECPIELLPAEADARTVRVGGYPSWPRQESLER